MTGPIPRASILIPTFNGERTIAQTIKSILVQSYVDFEIIVSDDSSVDSTVEIVKSFKNRSIRILENKKNVGYPGNLQRAFESASGDIIFLMGQDDILHPHALDITISPFEDAAVTAVTRPYFWFRQTPATVDRVKKAVGDKATYLDVSSDVEMLATMFSSCDQLSGLAMRRSAITTHFHEDIFPCHVYPFASAMKSGKVLCLPEFTVAVRTESSQSRSVSSIYDKSPVQSWLDWLDFSFGGESEEALRKGLRKQFIGCNAIGLIQIRNYARRPLVSTCREIVLLVRIRPENIVDPQFVLIVGLCLMLPRVALRRLSDFVRRQGVGRWRARSVPEEIRRQFTEAANLVGT
jgi:glycosyltransferase involved in cell wall biosynthesis